MLLVELQNTVNSWTEKCLKDLTYAIILESWVFKDVKYDIPMCQSHSTRPQSIPLVPTMQKKLFTLSFQPKFLKIMFTKVTATSSKSYVAVNFLFFSVYSSLGACFGPQSPSVPCLEHPFFVTFPTERAQKRVKEWCEDTFMKEWMKALEKTRILAPADIRYLFSFGSYGRLKLKFLCELFSPL